MKKLLFIIVSILLIGATVLVVVLNLPKDTGNSGDSGNGGGEVTLTKEEQMSITDKDYDRAIYMTAGGSYNLKKQYEYEEYSLAGAEFTTDSDVITLEDGVITAKNTEDIVDGTIKATFQGKTENIVVHVLNGEKYGSKYTTVDAGLLYGKSVLFFGDSITHNWARYPNGNIEDDNGSTSLGYNHIPKLNAFCNFSSIVNAGWSGGTVCYVPSSTERFTYKSFPGSVDAHEEDIKNAQVIFVWYGTNDLTEQYSIGAETDTMVTDGVTDYGFNAGLNYSYSKIKTLNPNATIITMDIMVRDPINLGDIKFTDYNAAIKEASIRHNTRLLTVSKLFKTNNLKTYSNDGLHPNDEGYNVLTKWLLLDNKKPTR